MRLRDEEYRALVQRALTAFGKLPNVHTVGIGGRERAGKPTGELVLKVFVNKKVTPNALGPDALVPTEFEGVPTDVVEGPEVALPVVAPPGVHFGGPYPYDLGRYRPLRGGIQIQALGRAYAYGTLGMIYRIDGPAPHRIVGLTCHHVLFASVAAEVAALGAGQPTDNSSSTNCCRGLFGQFLRGFRDATMDVAAIVFDQNSEYFAQIEEIGVVSGDHSITIAEAVTQTYPVRKRGRTTRLTGGVVQAIHAAHASGAVSEMTVVKPNPEPAAGVPGFVDFGDSGAALVNDANEIVGIVFSMPTPAPGDFPVGYAFGYGIAEIKARYAAAGVDLVCEAAATLNEKRVVQLGPTASPIESAAPEIAREVEESLAHTPLGRELTSFWMRHSVELNQLVNRNRRVTTRWHRAGGPALFQSAMRVAYNSTLRIPQAIEGRPTEECVQAVLDLFDQHGSPSLRQDIRVYRGQLPPIAGRTYPELLSALRDSGSQEGASWQH